MSKKAEKEIVKPWIHQRVYVCVFREDVTLYVPSMVAENDGTLMVCARTYPAAVVDIMVNISTSNGTATSTGM